MSRKLERNRLGLWICPVCGERDKSLIYCCEKPDSQEKVYRCPACSRIIRIDYFTGEITKIEARTLDGPPEDDTHLIGCCEKKPEVKSKARVDLVPPVAIYAMAEALTFGAEKHGENNWREKKIDIVKRIGSALRHTLKFLAGYDYDEEMGVHHLGCAMASLAVVLESLKIHEGIDNRCPMPTHKLTDRYEQ